MNIHFADFFCGRCTPAGYKTRNDYFKVNLGLLREELFNQHIIIKAEMFYETAAYLLYCS